MYTPRIWYTLSSWTKFRRYPGKFAKKGIALGAEALRRQQCTTVFRQISEFSTAYYFYSIQLFDPPPNLRMAQWPG